ncbi:MAG TPA: hypothetical protein DCX03_07950 [Bacteroidales bacterium]|jgi:hypothetical protein|nr:hypothetical protein [Bacteroidales bacterium]
MLRTIIFQFTAYFIAGFILQPDSWVKLKRNKVITWYHVYYGLTVFLFSWLFSFQPSFWVGALYISIILFFTDILTGVMHRFISLSKLFFLMNLVNMIVIIGVTYGVLQNPFPLSITLRQSLIILAVITITKPANLIIKHLFDLFSIEVPNNNHDSDSLPNAGKLIGMAERLLALMLILSGQYEVVGLIIASKSILRLNSTQKSEYVLVGTLLSFGIAILLGVGIQTL